uniref:Arrestin n=1 Tax=Triops granarius TaxID=109777 RepID=D1MVD8_9CRUS|nr:arrestin [Triops granarius]
MVATVKVFKKTSPNGKVTVYLGKRDFVDHLDHVDPIEGVVVVDDDYLKDRKVFGQVITTFRYGREQDEVMGLKFSKELILVQEQVAPSHNKKITMSPLQERLVKKLGKNAYAFTFQLPTSAPPSVVLQEGIGPQGAPIGVEYDLRTFVGENAEDKGHKRSTVSMAIRKVQYAPLGRSTKQPSTIVSKGFTFSSGKITLETTLDKELYYHGEPVNVNVSINNGSKKSVKRITVAIMQNVEITVINGQYSKHVAQLETREGCPIVPGSSLSKVFTLTPIAANNKDKRGIALDGHLKDDDVNLASSTVVADNKTSEATGFVVSYSVRVKLSLGALAGELVADVPLKLMHPAPGTSDKYGKGKPGFEKEEKNRYSQMYAKDDDDENIVFEDFARLRMAERT